jgi:tetratricopeptide (TPR) repeat protein
MLVTPRKTTVLGRVLSSLAASAVCVLVAFGVVEVSASRAASMDEIAAPGPLMIWMRLPPCAKGQVKVSHADCLSRIDPSQHFDRALGHLWYRGWREARQEALLAIAAARSKGIAEHFAARIALTEFAFNAKVERHNEALRHLQEARAELPLSGAVLATLALAKEMRGDVPAALELFDQALRLEPYQVFGRFKRAEINFYSGRRAEALQDFDRLVELDPKDLDWRLWRARLHIDAKRYEAGLQDLKVASAGIGHHLGILDLQARANVMLGRLGPAHADLNALIDGPAPGVRFAIAGEDLARYLEWRSWVRIQLDLKKEAAVDLVKVLELGGRKKILQTQLALRRLGWNVEIDGELSDRLQAAVIGCIVDDKCIAAFVRRS